MIKNSLPSGYVEVNLKEGEEVVTVVKSKFWYQRRGDLKGKTGHWSKWGGAREDKNIYQDQVEDWWYCQNCGLPQPVEISPTLMEYEDLGSLRVCPVCFVEGCAEIKIRSVEKDD